MTRDNNEKDNYYWLKLFFISMSMGLCILMTSLISEIASANGAPTEITNILEIVYTVFLVAFSIFVTYLVVGFFIYCIKMIAKNAEDKKYGRNRF